MAKNAQSRISRFQDFRVIGNEAVATATGKYTGALLMITDDDQ
jgi:hypothetical protein